MFETPGHTYLDARLKRSEYLYSNIEIKPREMSDARRRQGERPPVLGAGSFSFFWNQSHDRAMSD
jgi:hypothetical protein